MSSINGFKLFNGLIINTNITPKSMIIDIVILTIY